MVGKMRFNLAKSEPLDSHVGNSELLDGEELLPTVPSKSLAQTVMTRESTVELKGSRRPSGS